MSLAAIVTVLGGDLYNGGRRANVPGPGHGPHDRSVSLLLDGGRVIVHSFGGSDWRAVRDDLRRRGLIDRNGRLTGARLGAEIERTCRPVSGTSRRDTARRLWSEGLTCGPQGRVARYLARRGLVWSATIQDLVEHPAAPYAAYRPGGGAGRALMAAVRDPAGTLTAVELTFLTPNGDRATGLRLSRKTIGQVPPGSAVRLCEAADGLVVAEGVITTLSAMALFARPGWALLSAGNLERWTPPAGVGEVVVAGDRGAAGEAAARGLVGRLRAMGVRADLRLPPYPAGDWNEALVRRN